MKTIDERLEDQIKIVQERYNKYELIPQKYYANKNTIKHMKTKGLTQELIPDERLIDNIIIVDFGNLQHKVVTLLL